MLKAKSFLKTLTALNKEVRPFFLSDNSIWSYPSISSLAITAFGGPEGYFNLAIMAFVVFPKYYHRLGNMDKRSLDSLVERGFGLQGWCFWFEPITLMKSICGETRCMWRFSVLHAMNLSLSLSLRLLGLLGFTKNQRKIKGQQLKGKIVSEFFTFFTLFPQDFPLQNKGF